MRKEEEAERVKQEIRIIWGDYFKTPHFKEYGEIDDLTHQIMQKASACKQGVHREDGHDLLNLINNFAEIFWHTKEVKRFDGYVLTLPLWKSSIHLLNNTEYPTMFGWTVIRIRGRSMSPALENGDFAIAKHLTREAHLSIGEIVLVDHPDLGLIVKYVMALSPSGVRLIGAASSSIDPYATGTIARDRVLSRLVEDQTHPHSSPPRSV